jgi:hypothetical protein
MAVKVTNNAFGTLSVGINGSVGTLTLTTGQGSRFPILGAGDWFWGTLTNAANAIEVVKVTARAADVLTITRGVDGTAGLAWLTADKFELRPTAALFNDKADVVAVTLKADALNPTTSGAFTHTAGDFSLDGNFIPGTDNAKAIGSAARRWAAITAVNITAVTFSGALTGNASSATTAAACTGNSASATTAAACTGNSATATTASALGSFGPGGLTEVGRYFDFHGTTNANDFDVRFDAGVTSTNGGGTMTVTCGAFTISGAMTAATVAQTSDERKKQGWVRFTDAQLDALAAMDKVGTFEWKDGSGPSVGGSAQEIQAIVPQAVHTDEDGNLTVNYGGLNFAILQAMLRRGAV